MLFHGHFGMNCLCLRWILNYQRIPWIAKVAENDHTAAHVMILESCAKKWTLKN